MLVIHPDECIDCGVCEPECPARAISSDREEGMEEWSLLNAEYAPLWPRITEMGKVPEDAHLYDGEDGKRGKYFSSQPGGLLR